MSCIIILYQAFPPPLLVSRMGEDRLVYICSGKYNLDELCSSSYGGPVDAIQRCFFGQDGVSLRKFSVEREPGDYEPHKNLILTASADHIEMLLYDLYNEMDFGVRSDRVHRLHRQNVVGDYVAGRIYFPQTFEKQKTKIYLVRPEGPKVIVIDTSRSVTKRQPSLEQYVRIVERHGGIPHVVNEDITSPIRFEAAEPSSRSGPPEEDDRYSMV